jgi:hypothetical protein
MSAGVGADVEALCSKCGDVWHVVVAKVGQQIVKVQCKQCHGYHRYKSPHGAPPDKKLPASSRPAREAADDASPGAKAAGRAAARPPTRPPIERFEKPAVTADLSKPVRPYRASNTYEVAERIDHPSFGQGVIEVAESGKVTVFFASGRRVLAQAKTAETGRLARPKPFDHENPPAGGKPIGET